MPWQKSFQLKEFADFWRVSPISFHDGSYGSIELKKELLEQGSHKTLMEWLSYSTKAAALNQFYAGSAPLHHSLTDLLCENEDHPYYKKNIEEIRNFLEKELQSNLYVISIPFYYASPLPDRLNHFQGSKSYITLEHLFGVEGILQQLWDADRICTALLGEEDSHRVNKVSQWLCHKDTYLCRERTKSSLNVSGGVQIGIDAQHFRIEITSASTYSKRLPALGMRIRKLHRRKLQ